jgi:hypothetical protein
MVTVKFYVPLNRKLSVTPSYFGYLLFVAVVRRLHSA